LFLGKFSGRGEAPKNGASTQIVEIAKTYTGLTLKKLQAV
jgi:hypothetical protein